MFVLAILVGICWLSVTDARAQSQESGLLNRIEHPDRTLKYDPADKAFSSRSAFGSKEAAVRPFAFSRPAKLRENDTSLQAYRFGGKDEFRTNGFATKADRATGGDAFAQKDRGFATKALPVQAAPAADKSAGVMREYLHAQRPTGKLGKRQDTIDELRSQQNLSIDEVREILNKPNGRPGARPDVGSLPVLRARPVNVPSAQ